MKRLIGNNSLCTISLLQALELTLYISAVALLFWKGNKVFGKMDPYLGPILFLILFVISALISAFIVLGYPFWLFWEKKKTAQALRLVGYTTAWLVGIFFVIFLILIVT